MSWLCSPFRTGSEVSLTKEAYPSGKALANAAPNFSPDSNGLGKLAYYGEMNPTQLSKIAGLLLKSARADVKSAPNNQKAKARLCITLAILKRLIVDCRAHLSFFAREAVEVIELASGVHELPSPSGHGGRRDIEVAERAASAFHAFATYAEQTSVGIDAFVTGHYLSILAQFGSLAKEPYSTDSSVPGTRLVGLHGIDGAVSSDILFTAHFEEQARHIVPALIFNVLPTASVELEDLQKLSKEDTRNKEFKHAIQKRRPILERKARSIRSGKGDEKDVYELDVAANAIKILKTLFASGHSTQISASIEAAITFLSSRDGGARWQNVEWCNWLADSMALWTHLQYRFVVLASLLDALAESVDEPNVTNQSLSICAMIRSVLTSKTSLVGLGIGDIMAQLLGLIAKRSRVGSSDAMLPALADCVSSLAAHIYYSDQVNDMVQDIVVGIQGLQNRDSADMNESATRTAVRVHTQCLYMVLQQAAQTTRKVVSTSTHAPKEQKDSSAPTVRVSSAGKRSPVTPTTFQESLFLMVDADPVVRATYLHALYLFVKHELSHESAISNSRESTLRFYHALHAHAYELCTSHSVGFGSSRPTSTRGNTSRKTSYANSFAEGSSGVTASPADFALLRDVLILVHSAVKSSEAAVAGLPMLFTLEQNAPSIWSAENELGRRVASFEVTRAAFGAAGQTWNVKVAEPSTPSILPEKVSYDLSANQNYKFGSIENAGKALRPSATPDVFATSSALQSASGLSQAELQAGLSGVWTAESALQRSGRNNTPYAQGTLRVISTTALGAVGQMKDGSPPVGISLRSPSVADLKATLGESPSSPTSMRNGTGSIKSSAISDAYTDNTATSPKYARRRSSRIPKHDALALLDQLDQATVSNSPVKSHRLSVVVPPYQ